MKIIHVGLPKTGTTNLQTGLLKVINHELKLPEVDPFLRQRIVTEIRFPNTENFSSTFFQGLPDRFLISAESFTGFNPKYWQRNLEKLVNATDDSTYFIVCVRRPSQWMRSCFLQLSKSNYNGTFDDLFVKTDEHIHSYRQLFTINCEIYKAFLEYVKNSPKIHYYEYSKDADSDFISALRLIYPEIKFNFTNIQAQLKNKPYGEFIHLIRKTKNQVGSFFGLTSYDRYVAAQKDWQYEGEELYRNRDLNRPINKKFSKKRILLQSIDRFFYKPAKVSISESWLQEMMLLDEEHDRFFKRR